MKGRIWDLHIQPFLLDECMSASALQENAGDCNSLLLRLLLFYNRSFLLQNVKWGGKRKFYMGRQREMIALLAD